MRSQIDQEREQTGKNINNIKEQMKRECAQYKVSFEAEAQKMSTHYAQSTLVGEVASFLLSQLVTEINCADRISCIKEVGVNAVSPLPEARERCDSVKSINNTSADVCTIYARCLFLQTRVFHFEQKVKIILLDCFKYCARLLTF